MPYKIKNLTHPKAWLSKVQASSYHQSQFRWSISQLIHFFQLKEQMHITEVLADDFHYVNL